MPTINIRSVANYKSSEGADSATNPDAGKIADAALPRGALGRDLVPVTNAIRMMGRDIVKQVDQIRRGVDAVATPISRSLSTRGPAGAQGQARISGQRSDRMQLQITVRDLGPRRGADGFATATGGGGRGGGVPPNSGRGFGGGYRGYGWNGYGNGSTPGSGGDGDWGTGRWPRYRGRAYGGGMGPWGQRGGGMSRGGGGGGRRGGGGGGGRGYYGGGGAWNSGFGLGSVGRGAIEIGVIGLAVRELKELVEFVANPLRPLGTIENEKLGLAKPYMDLSNSMFGLARAGKFSGAGLLSNVMPRLSEGGQPSWMQAMNLGPEQAGRLLSGYGYVPAGSSDQTDLLKSLAFHENVAGGFQGLAPGSAVGSAALARGTGAIQPGGEDRYLSSLNRILEDSFAKGMDRSRILDSMNSSLELLKNAGAMPGSDATSLMEIMRNSGTMAGRTGELGTAAVAGFSNIPSGIGSSPVVSRAYMNKLSGVSTPEGLGAVYGISPAAMTERMKNPAFAAAANSMLGNIKSGNVGLAAATGSTIMAAGNPLAQAQLLDDSLKSMIPDPLVRANAIAAQMGGGVMNLQAALQVTTGAKGAELSAGINGGVDAAGLGKAGVKYGDVITAAATKYGIEPGLLAAIIDKESSGNADAGKGTKSTHLGLGQLGAPERAMLGIKNPFDPVENAEGAAKLLRMKIDKTGSITGGIASYGDQTAGYVPDVLRREAHIEEMAGTPKTFGPESSVQTLDMALASQDFHAFVQIIPSVNGELAKMLTAVQGVTNGLNALKGQLPGGQMQHDDVGKGGWRGMLQGFENGTMVQ